jgi:hypothetical protein
MSDQDPPQSSKKRTSSRRRIGGVPNTKEFLRSSIANPSEPGSPAKPAALLEVAEFLALIYDRALAGDEECGYFLGELIPFVWKNRLRLAATNKRFRDCYSQWGPARPGTRKDAPLRKVINRIILEAKHERRILAITKDIEGASLVIRPNPLLSALPEFGPRRATVEKWMNVVVYPRLRRMESQLRDDPEIAKLKKAFDRHGKFRVSRLKPNVLATLRRIAALPQSYYFNIA